MDNQSGKLYIVATPIGNLEDITLRALRILKDVDFVACEDTRKSKILLNHYSINTPLISYHQHSKLQKIDLILNKLKEGKNIALVTDAGTPGISDPGNKLIEEILKENIQVVPIPGPSALGAMISIAGINMQEFSFLGFPPHKKGRETFFREVGESKCPVIFYESVHRIQKALEQIKKIAPEKRLIVGRELTKHFETVYRGTAEQISAELKPENLKGEFVVIAY
jgi:16S rRNA (cytidine1402-2'-O)-methyltransferase